MLPSWQIKISARDSPVKMVSRHLGGDDCCILGWGRSNVSSCFVTGGYSPPKFNSLPAEKGSLFEEESNLPIVIFQGLC